MRGEGIRCAQASCVSLALRQLDCVTSAHGDNNSGGMLMTSPLSAQRECDDAHEGSPNVQFIKTQRGGFKCFVRTK